MEIITSIVSFSAEIIIKNTNSADATRRFIEEELKTRPRLLNLDSGS